MTDITKRRAIYQLGERAIQYYVDTGLCVFCSADDCAGIPHEEHCNVGILSNVVVDDKRRADKAVQRAIMDSFILQEAQDSNEKR